MEFSMSYRTFLGSAVILVAAAIAGCQSHGNGKAPDMGVTSAPPPPTDKAADLSSYCPHVTLREGTSFYTEYARTAAGKKKSATEDATAGAPGDALTGDQADDKRNNVIYEAAIADVTRTCNTTAGTIHMAVAVAGKIVPGPKGQTGTVTVPIRVAVVRGDEVLYSKLTPFPVNIADTAAATQFLFKDTDVAFPVPTERNIQVFAGFDSGPAAAESGKSKKKKKH